MLIFWLKFCVAATSSRSKMRNNCYTSCVFTVPSIFVSRSSSIVIYCEVKSSWTEFKTEQKHGVVLTSLSFCFVISEFLSRAERVLLGSSERRECYLLYTKPTAALTRRQVRHYIAAAEFGSLRLVENVRVFQDVRRKENKQKQKTNRKKRRGRG
jgi:hypothetical protein